MEIISSINTLDKTLTSLSGLWRDAETTGFKQRTMNTINEGLDERLKLMALRDIYPDAACHAEN